MYQKRESMDQTTASLINLLEASAKREKEHSAQMLQLQKEYQQKIEQMQKEMQAKIDSLVQQLAWLQRKMFGKMSERYISSESIPSLFDELWNQEQRSILPIEPIQLPEEITTVVKKKKQRVHRKDIMEGLPVFPMTLEPEGVDLTRYKKISEESTKILEFEPGKLYVVEIKRPKYALIDTITTTDEKDQVIIAPMPLLPIYKSMAGASLLTEILIGKYVYHLPFYRQIQQFKDLGLRLSSSTINDWFINTCNLLEPLYKTIRQKVLDSDYIQADETVLPVINKEKKKTDNKYIWLVRSVKDKLLFFDYHEGARSQVASSSILKGFKGYLQSDAYNGYDVFNKYIDVHRIGCWAHCRRKYSDSLTQNKELSEEALNLIQNLYAVERYCTEQGYTPEQRREKREELSLPIVNQLIDWINKNQNSILPGSKLGEAMSYTRNNINFLTEYIHNGELLIDNNLAENAIRPLAVSRKNFLFCGNHKSAENTAKVISILGSCKEHNINTRDYLIDVLGKLPYYIDKKQDLTELLPNEWIKTHPESIRLSDDVH